METTEMITEAPNILEPIVSMLAWLVSGVPGMIIPGLFTLAAILGVCAWLDVVHSD